MWLEEKELLEIWINFFFYLFSSFLFLLSSYKINIKSQVKADTKVDIPFWLAKQLVPRGIVKPLMPKCFGSKARASLEADPLVVNLNDLSPYFYYMALFILEMCVNFTTNNKQQTTNNKQQTTKQQTTNNKQQTTNNKQKKKKKENLN